VSEQTIGSQTGLRRVIGLPLLVFYGVGVTVGAGIFALIGEVLAVAGDHAPYGFLVAGIVAGFTAFSYAALSSAFPKAAGEVLYVKHGLGDIPGRIVGYALVVTALASSAVISLAFARYASSFSGVPEWLGFIAILVVLAGVAIAGGRESMALAAVITCLEVGTLLVVIAVGLPQSLENGMFWTVLAPPAGVAAWSGVMAGAFLAFFAFIGFEDIVNMAEETRDAERAVPKAVIWTLVISVAVYGLVAAVAAAHPDRAVLTASKAPLAVMFEGATGRSGAVIAVMASIAMVNGILVQIVMASRVIYGMANEGMMPKVLGRVDERRQTPVIAILLITALIVVLGLTVPLLRLAETTSLVILSIFAAVNFSLFLLGRRAGAPERLHRWRWWGLAGTAISLGLIASEVLT